jgi:hypothetical protein
MLSVIDRGVKNCFSAPSNLRVPWPVHLPPASLVKSGRQLAPDFVRQNRQRHPERQIDHDKRSVVQQRVPRDSPGPLRLYSPINRPDIYSFQTCSGIVYLPGGYTTKKLSKKRLMNRSRITSAHDKLQQHIGPESVTPKPFIVPLCHIYRVSRHTSRIRQARRGSARHFPRAFPRCRARLFPVQ